MEPGHIILLQFSSSFFCSNAEYGEGIGTIWLDEVSCSPGSKSLSSCVHNELNNSDCSHAEDAGVSCEGPGNNYYYYKLYFYIEYCDCNDYPF